MSSANASTTLRHERIMASAGSGKTFQLTNRYLRLILDGESPRSILASTFTRLAAGEIRDRILGRLADAATNEDTRQELVEHAGVKALTQESVLEHLVRLAQQIHQLQIRTIDSFFGGIVRCFALELGIDPASTIADAPTEQRMRRDAIARMLDEADPQPMIDLLRVLTDGSTEQSVIDSIDAIVSTLYELYRDAPREAWEQCPAANQHSPTQIIDAVQVLQDCDLGTTNGHVRNAHAKAIETLQQIRHDDVNAWLSFVSKGLAAKIADGSNVFYRVELSDSLIAAYQPLVTHANAVLQNSVRHRTLAMRELLDRFHTCYQQIKHDEKLLTFADITWALAEADQLGTLDDICFRLDATLRHVLLDEMQDTNYPQWRAMSPMIQEIISYAPPERTFFCVGDVKQSIYVWREASPEILENLCDKTLTATGEQVIAGDRQLAKSYRSSPIIMDVVNRVLRDTSSNNVMAQYEVAAGQWDAAYVEHESARTSMPGYAELRTVSEADPDAAVSQERVKLLDAARFIRDLRIKHPTRSIGVLTRKNAAVNTLLYELGPANLNVPNVSGNGGGNITDSAAATVILDLLTLADHPDHTIAAFNVMHSPLGPLLGLRHAGDRQRVARSVRQRVLDDGFARTIGQWIKHIAPYTDQRQLRRLVQLQTLATTYDRKPTLRCQDFVEFAKASTISEVSAASVQIMTVHRSKGLEFDLVVLPDLEGHLARSTFTALYDRDPDTGMLRMIARHINKDITEAIPDLRQLRDAMMTRKAREGLCLLYVAMTRARYALHMLINPSGQRERNVPKTYAGLLRCALCETTEQVAPEETLYSVGDEAWDEHAQADETSADDESMQPEHDTADALTITLASDGDDIPRGRMKSSASAHDDNPQAFAQLFDLPHTESRERGTVIHRMFEQVTWLDDDLPNADRSLLDPAHLQRLAKMLAPRRSAAWADEQVESFQAMLTQPEVKAALSRHDRDNDTPNTRLELHREYPYARMVDGAVQRGYIDRLVVRRVEDRVVAAEIIDFKTDAIEPDDVDLRAAQYRSQLETYRTAAAAALGIDTQHITMTLLFVSCGRAVRL